MGVFSNQMSRRVKHSCAPDCVVIILGRKCMLMSLSCSRTWSKDFKMANTELTGIGSLTAQKNRRPHTSSLLESSLRYVDSGAMCVHHACFPNLVDGSRNLGECVLVVVAGHYTLEPDVSQASTRVACAVATHKILCLFMYMGFRCLLQICLGFIARRRI